MSKFDTEYGRWARAKQFKRRNRELKFPHLERLRISIGEQHIRSVEQLKIFGVEKLTNSYGPTCRVYSVNDQAHGYGRAIYGLREVPMIPPTHNVYDVWRLCGLFNMLFGAIGIGNSYLDSAKAELTVDVYPYIPK